MVGSFEEQVPTKVVKYGTAEPSCYCKVYSSTQFEHIRVGSANIATTYPLTIFKVRTGFGFRGVEEGLGLRHWHSSDKR